MRYALMALFLASFVQAGEPKLDLEEASRTARSAVKGGSVERAELVDENGKKVWDFTVRGPSGIQNVRVDADNGAVLENKPESDETSRALDAIDKRRAELEKELEQAEATGRQKWQSVRPHIQRALQELERGVDAVKSGEKKKSP